MPGDLSVVGFDDIQLAQHMHPPLTTLAQDKTGLGVAAASALLRQIEGADTAEPVTLPVDAHRPRLDRRSRREVIAAQAIQHGFVQRRSPKPFS